MKFTFKKAERPTGLSAIGSPHPWTKIKVDKLVVGDIVPPTWQTKTNQWKVMLAISKEKTEADPASFRWITLKRRFDSKPEARKIFKEGNVQVMLENLGLELYQFPKDTY